MDFMASRQGELGVTQQQISYAINDSLPRVTNLLQGKTHATSFTLAEIGRLADVLACRSGQLLVHNRSDDKTPASTDTIPLDLLVALLRTTDAPVSVTTLAEAIGTSIDAVDTAPATLMPSCARSA